MVWLFICIIIGYFLGSLPTSILVSRFWRKIDIRQYGSGNAGFTNVARVLGWKPAAIVLIVDVSKSFIVTYWISRYFAQFIPLPLAAIQLIAGTCAVVGHIWTVFAGFRGGKGVLAALGMFLAIAPIPTLISLVVGGLVMLVFRYVSLGSMAGGLTLPIAVALQKYYFQHPIHNILMIFSICIAFLIIFTHRTNIQRLVRGTENRIGGSHEKV